MSFPELLRQCRKQKHMSQAELASLLGVTQQAVGKWESGKSSPDPTTVAKLAEILDTTADYLLGLFDPTAEGQTEERFFGSYVYSLIPVIGTVKAGYGALAYEEDYGKEYARVKDLPATSISLCAATAWSPASTMVTLPGAPSGHAGKRRPGRADLRRRGRGYPQALPPARQLRGAAALQPGL